MRQTFHSFMTGCDAELSFTLYGMTALVKKWDIFFLTSSLWHLFSCSFFTYVYFIPLMKRDLFIILFLFLILYIPLCQNLLSLFFIIIKQIMIHAYMIHVCNFLIHLHHCLATDFNEARQYI